MTRDCCTAVLFSLGVRGTLTPWSDVPILDFVVLWLSNSSSNVLLEEKGYVSFNELFLLFFLWMKNVYVYLDFPSLLLYKKVSFSLKGGLVFFPVGGGMEKDPTTDSPPQIPVSKRGRRRKLSDQGQGKNDRRTVYPSSPVVRHKDTGRIRVVV